MICNGAKPQEIVEERDGKKIRQLIIKFEQTVFDVDMNGFLYGKHGYLRMHSGLQIGPFSFYRGRLPLLR